MVRKGKRPSHLSGLKRLSLLDPEAPEGSALQNADESHPDRVYLHAAAIFQDTHLDKPATHRLITYGKRSEVSVPVVRDGLSQRLAYQLAFNTLKCEYLTSDCVPLDRITGVS